MGRSNNDKCTSTKLLCLVFVAQSFIRISHAWRFKPKGIKDDYPFFRSEEAKDFIGQKNKIKKCVWDNFDAEDVKSVRQMLDIDNREYWKSHGITDLTRWKRIYEDMDKNEMEDSHSGVKEFFECNEGVLEADTQVGADWFHVIGSNRRGRWIKRVKNFNSEEAANCREESREDFMDNEDFKPCDMGYNTLPLKLPIPWEKCKHKLPGDLFPLVRFKNCTCNHFGDNGKENDCLFGKTFSDQSNEFCRDNPEDLGCLTVQEVRGKHTSFAFPKTDTPSSSGLNDWQQNQNFVCYKNKTLSSSTHFSALFYMVRSRW